MEKTCFLGKHEVHSVWITLLDMGLDQLTSARSALLNLAWLLKGYYTSRQAAHLRPAKGPWPRCSPLAVSLCRSIHPLAWIAPRQRARSRDHLGRAGRRWTWRRRGWGTGGDPRNKCPFFPSLAGIPPSLLCSDLHLLRLKSVLPAGSACSVLSAAIRPMSGSACTQPAW